MNNTSNWIKIVPELTDLWDFDKNNVLEGVFIEKKTDVGPNNSNIYVIKTDEGKFSVWGNTVLDSRLDGFVKGEEIKIEYKGMTPSQRTGKEYKDYDIYHRPLEKVDDVIDIDE